MKGPSIQKTAVFSAGLHIMFFLLSLLILRQSHEMVMPSPYIVSLVSPAGQTQKRGATVEPGAASPAAEKNQTTTHTEATHIDEKKEQKTIEESIAALKAKKKKEKQLEKILSVRRTLVSIQGKGGSTSAKAAVKGAGPAMGAGEASYIDKITGQIHEAWTWPGYAEKDLEAIISVKIQKDGTISVVNFEKKSGNRLFDKLALRTIEKASPVTPPPYEMEIGIRFYP